MFSTLGIKGMACERKQVGFESSGSEIGKEKAVEK